MFEADQLECVKGYDALFSNLSFTVEPGDVLQIQGTNGSGKTSLLRILTGLSLPESGEVRWNGTSILEDADLFNAELAYVGHLNGLKADLSAIENLELSQKYHLQTTDITPESALEKVGLAGYEHIPSRQLSAGQKRRVALARLHMSTARLWVLDEPITAIDVDGVEKFEAVVEAHAQSGGMVILTSHQPLAFGMANSRSISLNS